MCLVSPTMEKKIMSSTSGKSYRIEEDSLCGRQLVAVRKILAGEIIIDEPALLTGPGFIRGETRAYFKNKNEESATGVVGQLPHQDSSGEEHSVCLVCCANLTSANRRQCSSCSLLLCSETCQNHTQHSQNECLIFPEIRHVWDCNPNRSKASLYHLVLVIRGLFYKFRNPPKWDQLRILESKSEALVKVGASSELQDVFNCLSWHMFSSSHFLQERNSEINANNNYSSNNEGESIVEAAQHCLGVMRINAFSNFSESYSREGLFFLSSFMSHSCIINTDRQMEAGGCITTRENVADISESRMVVRASVDIEKDEPIKTTYLSLLYSTEERTRLMISSWLFTCQCIRCRDPVECQAFSSGIVCQEKLSHCSTTESRQMSRLICTNDFINRCVCRTGVETHIDQMAKSRPKNLHEVENLEAWLDQYDTGERLHPHHSLFAHTKLFLSQFLGRQSGGMDALSVNQLKRKIVYCRQILAIYDIVCPGLQMCRGVMLFELWCAVQKLSDLHVPIHINYPLLVNENDSKPAIMISIKLENREIAKIKMEALHILQNALPNSSEEAMALILREDV